jgi:hypothetical protein
MISVQPWQLAIIVITLTFGPQCHASELIRNGNFEKGNRDFRSDYPEGLGSYLVTRNLRNFHLKQSGNIGLFGDHTSGRGHMMAVDGATIAGKVVWEQTVKVLPNQEYNFSMYVASWSQASPAILEVIVNGREIASVEAPSKIAEWKRLNFKWQSELDSSAVIAIRNRNTNGDGNDFVIDDISLQGPRPFPPQIDALWDKYEKDASAIREKARADTDKRRQKLLADLQILLDGLIKEGKLDEALVLRQHIASVTEEFEAEENP